MAYAPTARLLAAGIALVAWFALGLQLCLILDGRPGNGLTAIGAVARFLLFFTILTNLLVAISTTALALQAGSQKNSFFRPAVLGATAVYIFIVGLVYNLILRQQWQPAGMHRVADELLHVAVPILYIAYWFVFVPKGFLNYRQVFYWLAFPGLYLIYALLRGNTEGFYAYPFINVKELGYRQVLINSIGVMLAFIITGYLLVAADKALARKK